MIADLGEPLGDFCGDWCLALSLFYAHWDLFIMKCDASKFRYQHDRFRYISL